MIAPPVAFGTFLATLLQSLKTVNNRLTTFTYSGTGTYTMTADCVASVPL